MRIEGHREDVPHHASGDEASASTRKVRVIREIAEHTPVESAVTPVESAVTPVESAVTPVESAVTPVESAVTPVTATSLSHKLRARWIVAGAIVVVIAVIASGVLHHQGSAAYDASAKELARTAQTTALTIATDNGGSFAEVTPKEMYNYESTIPISQSSANGKAWLSDAQGDKTSYVVTVISLTRNKFSVEDNNGITFRYCGGSNWIPPTLTQLKPAPGTATVGTCVDGSW